MSKQDLPRWYIYYGENNGRTVTFAIPKPFGEFPFEVRKFYWIKAGLKIEFSESRMFL